MAKILVADDELDKLESLIGQLGEKGHDVITVASGEAALAEIRREGALIELALLDNHMKYDSFPPVDGSFVIAELAAKMPDAMPKIIGISSTPDEFKGNVGAYSWKGSEVEEKLDDGSVVFIEKGNTNAILARIEKWVGRGPDQPGAVVQR